MKDFEKQEMKNKVTGDTGYGIMWLFVFAVIEWISISKGYEPIIYHAAAAPALCASGYKFYTAFRKFKRKD